MAKISLGALFIWAFVVSAIPLFFIIRYGEERGTFDSIGAWYTIYSAVFSALIFGAVVVIVAHLMRSVRSLRKGSDRARTDA